MATETAKTVLVEPLPGKELEKEMHPLDKTVQQYVIGWYFIII
jgi:hypothetical protein